MRRSSKSLLSVLLVAAAVLSACSSEDTDVSTTVPSSQAAETTAVSAGDSELEQLVVMSAETVARGVNGVVALSGAAVTSTDLAAAADEDWSAEMVTVMFDEDADRLVVASVADPSVQACVTVVDGQAAAGSC